jgi:hypothetical protein
MLVTPPRGSMSGTSMARIKRHARPPARPHAHTTFYSSGLAPLASHQDSQGLSSGLHSTYEY